MSIVGMLIDMKNNLIVGLCILIGIFTLVLLIVVSLFIVVSLKIENWIYVGFGVLFFILLVLVQPLLLFWIKIYIK